MSLATVLYSKSVSSGLLTGLFCGFLILYYYYSQAWPIMFYIVNNITILNNPITTSNYLSNIQNNSFQSALNISTGNLLVDSEKCKIPDFDLWEPDVLKLVTKKPIYPCSKKMKLTYVKKNKVIINANELKEAGLSLKNISCCYQTVERVNQPIDNFDIDADNKYRFSNTCYPMNATTEPISGYLKVTCKTIAAPVKTIYENLHVLAHFSDENIEITQKLAYWKNHTTEKNLYPNVLLLGIDSTSRLNFKRFMNKTLGVLGNMSAIEIKGYTKVGDNTYPNFVPLMSGKTIPELKQICLPKDISGHDNCPFLWRNFSSLNYLTAHLEDSPRMSINNYHKTGFVRPPTDIYLRPWMLAAYTENDKHKNTPFTIDCLGYQRPEEIILDYIVDIATLANSSGIPYFITTWLTDLTHEDMNSLQALDDPLARSLQKLVDLGLLSNTVLIVISDHGYRWGEIRSTVSGWFELKLPALYTKLPEELANQHPEWLEALQYNANQLSTPFDLHETINDIIGLSDISHHTRFSPGNSLFKKLPEQTCEEAGVPPQYCACYAGSTNPINTTLVKHGANEIVQHINHDLPQNCSLLTLKNITAVVVASENKSDCCVQSEYSISIETLPGNLQFEGLVVFNQTNISEVISSQVLNVQRTSKKDRKTECLGEHEQSFELLCYCKP